VDEKALRPRKVAVRYCRATCHSANAPVRVIVARYTVGSVNSSDAIRSSVGVGVVKLESGGDNTWTFYDPVFRKGIVDHDGGNPGVHVAVQAAVITGMQAMGIEEMHPIVVGGLPVCRLPTSARSASPSLGPGLATKWQ
jgi:hypothetical protein